MTQILDTTTPVASTATDDLLAAIQRVLAASPEPLTLSKIRSHLPTQLRADNLEDVLRRQVAANVLQQYPKYRSQHERYWDRPMPVHVAALIKSTLEEGALAWSELRRKLPAYAQTQAENVLQELLARKELYTHPRTGRGGERFGVRPPDPKDYLRSELSDVIHRLEKLGFNQSQIRAGALELLHDEEWKPELPRTSAPKQQSEPAETEVYLANKGGAPASESSAGPAASQPSTNPSA